MAINGLGSFDMMSNYNRIKFNDNAVNAVKPVAQEAPKATKEEKQVAQPELKVNLNLDGMRRRSGLNLEDISKDFTRREPFVMSTFDDQTMKSDILKAVSEMEKDTSIQQYNYFVGDSNVIVNDEDGIVIQK